MRLGLKIRIIGSYPIDGGLIPSVATKEVKKMLRFENPIGNTLNANRTKHLIKYMNCNDIECNSAHFSCNRCGSLIFWHKIIIVRYGLKDYEINAYCRNCFELEFPTWKRFLINHCKWYRSKYAKKEGCCYSNHSEFNLKPKDDNSLNYWIFPKTKRYKKVRK